VTETLTHALTIRHPFAYATAAGWKPIENKDVRPSLARIGELIGIHAGLQWARASDLPSWAKGVEMPRPDDKRLVYGALIGVARLVGVVREVKCAAGVGYEVMRGRSVGEAVPLATRDRIRPWWRGPWGWLWEEPLLLPEPIPMRGQQGVWRIGGESSVMFGGSLAACRALEQWRKARETQR
jgi:hypothetical protein